MEKSLKEKNQKTKQWKAREKSKKGIGKGQNDIRQCPFHWSFLIYTISFWNLSLSLSQKPDSRNKKKKNGESPWLRRANAERWIWWNCRSIFQLIELFLDLALYFSLETFPFLLGFWSVWWFLLLNFGCLWLD